MLFGCRTWPHTTQEVRNYVEKNISKHPCIISDAKKDGKNLFWLIYFEDEPDYSFGISSDMSSSFGIPKGYVINDNFDSMFQYYYFSRFLQENKSILYLNPESWAIGFFKGRYSNKFKQGDESTLFLDELNYYYSLLAILGIHSINGKYSTKEEAQILASDIIKYWEYVKTKKYLCDVSIEIKYYKPTIIGNNNYNDNNLYFHSKQKNIYDSPYIKYLGEIDIEYELIKVMENYESN